MYRLSNFNALNLSYKVSTLKALILKMFKKQVFFCLLPTTEFKFPPKIVGYLNGPPLGHANGAHAEVY
jgi:hypothetical protein